MPINFDRLLNLPALAVYGQAVVYQRPDEAPVTIRGIFDRRATIVTFSEGVPITGQAATLSVRTADLGGRPPQQGDGIVIGNDAYWVEDPQLEPTGSWLLILGARAPGVVAA